MWDYPNGFSNSSTIQKVFLQVFCAFKVGHQYQKEIGTVTMSEINFSTFVHERKVYQRLYTNQLFNNVVRHL